MRDLVRLAGIATVGLLPLTANALEIGEFDLFEGQLAQIPVSQGTPATLVRLAATGQGEGMGPCPPPLLGACLGIVAPKILGVATSDANGDVSFPWTPPAGSLGRDVSLQAMEVVGGAATLSTPVTVTITMPPANHQLTALTPSVGTLNPAFDPDVTSYILTGTAGAGLATFTPEAGPDTEILVDGLVVASGDPSLDIELEEPDLPGGNYITITAEDLVGGQGTTTYLVEVSNLIEETLYLKMDHPGESDEFGRYMSMSGNRLAVAAAGDDSASDIINGDETDNTGSFNGSVTTYLYDELTGVWTKEAYLKPFNPDEFDQFGISVALSGDRLLVGATGGASSGSGINSGTEFDNSLDLSGAAYMFTFDDVSSTWSQEAYILSDAPLSFGLFGGVVALEDNYAAVTSSWGTGSAALSGVVEIFEFDTGLGAWTFATSLVPPSLDTFDGFGAALAFCGERILVGVPDEDSAGTGIDSGTEANNGSDDSGAVYAYLRDAGTGSWNLEAYIKSETNVGGERFGSAIDCDDDMMAVGLGGAAAVALYEHDGLAWTPGPMVEPPAFVSDDDAFANRGNNVALDAERGLLMVGATEEDTAGTGVNSGNTDLTESESGAVFVFRRGDDGVWREKFHLKASNAEFDDEFGSAVVMNEGLFIVGAENEKSNASGMNGDGSDNTLFGSGAVYVFEEVF